MSIEKKVNPSNSTGYCVPGNELYRSMVEQSREMFYLHDTEGLILEVNQAAVDWTGYSREELTAMNVFDLHPVQVGREDVIRQWKSWKPGVDYITLEFEHKRKDGTLGPVEVSTGKVLVDNRELILAITRDVTERRAAAIIFEESRDWYRALAEDIPVLVTRVSAEGIVTYINESSASLIGRPREAIVGTDFFQLVPPAYREKLIKGFATLTPEKPIVVFEHRNKGRLFRWKNRAVFNNDGNLKEYFTVGEDITAYRLAEHKLRESEERNRVLVEALPDLIFRYSSEGVYLDAEVKDLERLTEKGCKLYEAGKLIGSSLYDAIPADLADMVMKVISRVVETGEAQVVEYSYLVAGEHRHHESRIVKSGHHEVMSIVRDITDRKRVEETLQYQLHYEKVVAEISSRFVGSGVGCIDENINYAIRLCGRLFGADRCYIFRFSDDGCYMTNTHEWCAEGVISQIERNRNYPVSDTPWWAEQIKNNDIFQVADIEALPPEADKDKVEFRYEQIKSCLTIPMYRDGKIFGFFGFDAVKEKKNWTESQVALLKVIAETIAGAIINYESEQALRESEERYREILATIEEGYYEVDLTGRMVFCNDASCRLFGDYSREELLGTSYAQLYRDPVEAYRTFNQVYVTGKPEKGLVLEMIRKDGSFGFGELSISLVRDKQGEVTGFKGIGRDVTERIEHEKQLKYLSLYDQLTGIFNRAWFEAELDRLDKSREYPITIASADLDGLKLINDTLGHNAGDKLLVACAGLLKESIRSSDILARVGGDEFSVILPFTDKATGESVVKRMREAINSYNENNEDLPLGLSLGLATADHGDLSLKELFKRADDMMYRDKLYRSSSSRGKIVQSLLAALAERDYITEGHARRLEDLCRLVGEKVNLGSHQLADLALLAQVHDLGKVGVPDHILFKPGPLTDDEWQIMRTHPEKGYRIATSSPDLAGIADYILKHHERWDGSGYPLGLEGTEIPVECRILAIVDAFDAMTSKRPYNKKKTTEEAVEEIKKHSGSQFDPDLVPVFLEVLNEVSE